MSLRRILKETFPTSNVPNRIDHLKMGDLEEWDSIGNFNLILAVEEHYQKKFTVEEIEKLNSIAEIKKALGDV